MAGRLTKTTSYSKKAELTSEQIGDLIRRVEAEGMFVIPAGPEAENATGFFPKAFRALYYVNLAVLTPAAKRRYDANAFDMATEEEVKPVKTKPKRTFKEHLLEKIELLKEPWHYPTLKTVMKVKDEKQEIELTKIHNELVVDGIIKMVKHGKFLLTAYAEIENNARD